jgi:hypothetical protein
MRVLRLDAGVSGNEPRLLQPWLEAHQRLTHSEARGDAITWQSAGTPEVEDTAQTSTPYVRGGDVEYHSDGFPKLPPCFNRRMNTFAEAACGKAARCCPESLV